MSGGRAAAPGRVVCAVLAPTDAVRAGVGVLEADAVPAVLAEKAPRDVLAIMAGPIMAPPR
jgi:hypothetical protein